MSARIFANSCAQNSRNFFEAPADPAGPAFKIHSSLRRARVLCVPVIVIALPIAAIGWIARRIA